MKKNQTVIMLMLFMSGLVIMMNLYLTIPLMKSVSQVFQVSVGQAGLLSSLFSLGFAIGCLGYGVLSEKYGRKAIILAGASCLTLITFLIGFSHSFPVIVVLRFLQGLAAATFSPVALAFAGEYFEGTKKTTAIGLISTGFLMAGIFGQVLASSVSARYSFQMVFVMMGCLLTIITLGLWLILPKNQRNRPQLVLVKSFANLKAVLGKETLLLCYLIAFFLLMSFVLLYSLLMAKLAQAPYSLAADDLLKVRLFGLLGMLVSPLAGWLAKHVSIKHLLSFSLCLAGVSGLFMGVVHSLLWLTILSVLFVLGIALAVPSLVSLVNYFGAFDRGLAVSIYTFVLFLGTSTAPFIANLLLPYSHTTYAFLLLGMIVFIPATLSLVLNRYD